MQKLTTSNIDFISVDEIYRIARAEMDDGDESHGIATRAIAEAHGDEILAKNLFIKFQYEEWANKEAWERAEYQRKERERKRLGVADKQWQQQMELERNEIVESEQRRRLKWQRKFEFERSEKSFSGIWHWAASLCVILAVVVVWPLIHKNKLSANIDTAQNPPYLAATVSTAKADPAMQYLNAAEQGDSKAQLDLALAYANGNGIAKDEAQAALWLRKAAEQGNAVAEDILGYLYANGKGAPKDQAQAVIWYRKAAEQGNINAQFNLAIAYKTGAGLAKDEAQAVKWFAKAAVQGDPEAQTILGKIYELGLYGVPPNDLQAQAWYQKAAAQGNQEALDSLNSLSELED